ncbi:Cell division protein MraZ [Roseibacterium elongatum DSM 19469]|uniref:Transcriptional regulator MraZ n=1 Tax=Roseicyclus elongatus DSM 19469 TaxID=1294273 RepID=W8RWJ1_9RHOB|nr:division/cell wall cluster transcriptional repressor MraZ [Roseibacterium elongatum]AHM05708.1 Cell division protein MraZ [Roseibacterium elongatum DSM 19469]
MDRRFLGESLNKVDGKGRVSIPAKFRRVLQNCDKDYAPGGAPRLYIAYGDPKKTYLECLSGDAFDQIDQMIQQLTPGSPLKKAMSYLYYTKCDATLLDDTGRLVLSQAAREKIDVDGEALFQGHGDQFHILKPSEASAADEDYEAMLAEMGQDDAYFDPLAAAYRELAARKVEPAE